jgi:hypothetical protein
MSINYITIQAINNFDEIINSPVFIDFDKMLQNKEIYENMWVISIDSKILKQLTIECLSTFIDVLLKKRTQQILQLSLSCPVIFYMWFDEMAAQLRFNIISNLNEKLPFKCKLNIVPSPDSILNQFLISQQHPEISWDELEEVSDDFDDKETDNFVLDVFVIQLNNPKFKKTTPA